jgi:hypothetical protein
VKHTEKNPTKPRKGKYVFEEGEWWYINAHDKNRRRATTAQNIQNTRMWVDGKYISKSHPLHQPGHYEGFIDAAFDSLQNYSKLKEGQVYIICNPAFPNWCKIGMAVDSQDRLKQYQTSSPYRDYELIKAYDTEDRREAETQAHALLAKNYEKRSEWFVCDASAAVAELDNLFENKQLELF